MSPMSPEAIFFAGVYFGAIAGIVCLVIYDGLCRIRGWARLRAWKQLAERDEAAATAIAKAYEQERHFFEEIK